MRTWPHTMTGCRGDSNKDERARAQVLHEMERRDAEAEKTREHAKFSWQLEQAEAVENAYVHAEAATRGNMLNAKSRGPRDQHANPPDRPRGDVPPVRQRGADEYYSTHHLPTAASFRGPDTRVHPVATERNAAGGRCHDRRRPVGQEVTWRSPRAHCGPVPGMRHRWCRNSWIRAILEPIPDGRPQADRIVVVQLTGEARHRARWRKLTAAEEAAAVAELRELARGRADLL